MDKFKVGLIVLLTPYLRYLGDIYPLSVIFHENSCRLLVSQNIIKWHKSSFFWMVQKLQFFEGDKFICTSVKNNFKQILNNNPRVHETQILSAPFIAGQKRKDFNRFQFWRTQLKKRGFLFFRIHCEVFTTWKRD